MPGLIHVVDDDASFLTAMERRLKHAGYDVATYPSALIVHRRGARECEASFLQAKRYDRFCGA